MEWEDKELVGRLAPPVVELVLPDTGLIEPVGVVPELPLTDLFVVVGEDGAVEDGDGGGFKPGPVLPLAVLTVLTLDTLEAPGLLGLFVIVTSFPFPLPLSGVIC